MLLNILGLNEQIEFILDQIPFVEDRLRFANWKEFEEKINSLQKPFKITNFFYLSLNTVLPKIIKGTEFFVNVVKNSPVIGVCDMSGATIKSMTMPLTLNLNKAFAMIEKLDLMDPRGIKNHFKTEKLKILRIDKLEYLADNNLRQHILSMINENTWVKFYVKHLPPKHILNHLADKCCKLTISDARFLNMILPKVTALKINIFGNIAIRAPNLTTVYLPNFYNQAPSAVIAEYFSCRKNFPHLNKFVTLDPHITFFLSLIKKCFKKGITVEVSGKVIWPPHINFAEIKLFKTMHDLYFLKEMPQFNQRPPIILNENFSFEMMGLKNKVALLDEEFKKWIKLLHLFPIKPSNAILIKIRENCPWWYHTRKVSLTPSSSSSTRELPNNFTMQYHLNENRNEYLLPPTNIIEHNPPNIVPLFLQPHFFQSPFQQEQNSQEDDQGNVQEEGQKDNLNYREFYP